MKARKFPYQTNKLVLVLALSLVLFKQTWSANLVSQETALQYIPKDVALSLEKNQIPKDAISISVLEITPGGSGKATAKTELDNTFNLVFKTYF